MSTWKITTLVFVLLASLHTHAQVLDVAFQRNDNSEDNGTPDAVSGAAAIGSTGDQWNTFSGAGGSDASAYRQNLVYTDGTNSGLALSVGPATYDSSQIVDHSDPALLQSGIIVQNSSQQGIGTGGFTISGFPIHSQQTVNLYLFGSFDNGAEFSLLGDPNVTDSLKALGTQSSSFATPANYVEFQNIKISDNPNEVISVQFKTRSGLIGEVNGFQLQIVPEPACGWLMIAGLLAIAPFFWRRLRV